MTSRIDTVPAIGRSRADCESGYGVAFAIDSVTTSGAVRDGLGIPDSSTVEKETAKELTQVVFERLRSLDEDVRLRPAARATNVLERDLNRAHLSERDQEILVLRFVDELNQSEIGQRIGVSQMPKSCLLAASLSKVREQRAAD